MDTAAVELEGYLRSLNKLEDDAGAVISVCKLLQQNGLTAHPIQRRVRVG
jgi:hypothetical protein